MATLKIPTSEIDWLVNRHHVGDTDAEITSDIEGRMKSGEFTAAFKRKCAEYALKRHKKNQTIYARVTRGGRLTW